MGDAGNWQVVWVSTRPDRSRRKWHNGVRCYDQLEASFRKLLDPELARLGLLPEPGDSIVGVVRMRPHCMFTHALELASHERVPWQIWRRWMLAQDRKEAFVFEVQHARRIVPAPWSHLEPRPKVGTHLFRVLPAHCYERLALDFDEILDEGDPEPVRTVRLPIALATLAVAGHVRFLVLPDCKAWPMGWRQALRGFWWRGMFPRPNPPLDDDARFDPNSMMLPIADDLRRTVACLQDPRRDSAT